MNSVVNELMHGKMPSAIHILVILNEAMKKNTCCIQHPSLGLYNVIFILVNLHSFKFDTRINNYLKMGRNI